MTHRTENKHSDFKSDLEIGDLKLQCSPLSDVGIDAMDEYVRQCYTTRSARLIEALSGEAQSKAIAESMQFVSQLTFVSALGAKFVGTVEGMAKLVYEMAKPNHPELEMEQIKSRMTNPEVIKKANQHWRHLQQLDKTSKEMSELGKEKDS